MAHYTQVYRSEVYEFKTEKELFAFTAELDRQGTNYSITVDKTYKVTIVTIL